jgi:hypothetical protein
MAATASLVVMELTDPLDETELLDWVDPLVPEGLLD